MDKARNTTQDPRSAESDGTKRSGILAACREMCEKTSGIAYCELEIIKAKYQDAIREPGKEARKVWQGTERDTIRKLVDLLDVQHKPEAGRPSPLLRVTEKSQTLPPSKWATFVDEKSPYLSDLRQIAQWARDSKQHGAGSQSRTNTYIFELYFLLYLLRRQLLPCAADPFFARMSDLVNSKPVREFAAETRYKERSSLSALPERVRISPIRALGEIEKSIDEWLTGRLITSAQHPDWREQYSHHIMQSVNLDTFIPLSIRLIDRQHFSKRHKADESSVESPRHAVAGQPEEPIKALIKRRRAIVWGDSGSGKTWLLRHTAVAWFNYDQEETSSEKTAICVQLKNFNLCQDISRLIINEICQAIGTIHQAEVDQWLHSDAGKSEHVALFLDGYNEIFDSNRQPFNQFFDEFMAGRNNRVLMSTRACDSCIVQPDWPRLIVAQLSDHQIRSYLARQLTEMGNQVYSRQIQDSQQLHALAANPFFLNLVVQFVKNRGPQQIPCHRARLIEAIVNDSLTSRLAVEHVHTSSTASVPEIMEFLAKVGHGILKLTERPFTYPEDIRPLLHYDRVGARQHLEYCKKVGILASSGTGHLDDRVLFVHDLFRDYFAATYMHMHRHTLTSRSLDRFTILETYLTDMRWNEPILMLADLCGTDTECPYVVQMLLHHDVFLGAEFLSRLSTVSARTLVSVARLAGTFEITSTYRAGWQNRPSAAAATLLAKLPEDQLKILYRKIPHNSCAWSSVALALVFKGGDCWNGLFPLRDNRDYSAYSPISTILARIQSKRTLLEIVKFIRKSLAAIGDGDRQLAERQYSALLNQHSFGLSACELLHLLEDSAYADVAGILSVMLQNVELGSEHVASLERLTESATGMLCISSVRGLARVKPALARTFLQPNYTKTHCIFAEDLIDIYKVAVQFTDTASLIEVLRQTLVKPGGRDQKTCLLFEILGDIATNEGADILLECLKVSNKYIPPEAFIPFARVRHFMEGLKEFKRRSGGSLGVRATIAFAIVGDVGALSELLPILELCFYESTSEAIDRALEGSWTQGIPRSLDFVDITTAEMAFDAVAQLECKHLAPRIFSMVQSGFRNDSVNAAAIEALVKLGHLPVLSIICATRSEDPASSYACALASELTKDLDSSKCREILVDLKRSARAFGEDSHKEGRMQVTLIAQSILRRRGWRLVEDWDGWPFGEGVLGDVPAPTGYRELEALLEETSSEPDFDAQSEQ